MKIKAVLITLLFASASPGQAALVQQFESWSVPTGLNGFDLFSFQPFDTSQGTLDRVTFEMQGNVTMSSPATPNLIPLPPFGGVQPVPYNYQIRMRMDVFALIGLNFDFVPDAKIDFSGMASGVGTVHSQTRQITITMDLSVDSDLLGFAIPVTSGVDIPPPTIDSSRGEFEADLLNTATGLEFQMLNTWSVIVDTGAAAVITPQGSSFGIITLGYHYTPFDEPPIPEVPVPAALWLFATALAGLAAIGKGKAKPG